MIRYPQRKNIIKILAIKLSHTGVKVKKIFLLKLYDSVILENKFDITAIIQSTQNRYTVIYIYTLTVWLNGLKMETLCHAVMHSCDITGICIDS